MVTFKFLQQLRFIINLRLTRKMAPNMGSFTLLQRFVLTHVTYG